MTEAVIARNCLCCNLAFIPKAQHGKFCSEKCRHHYRDVVSKGNSKHIAICPACAKEFETIHGIYCSRACCRSPSAPLMERKREAEHKGKQHRTRPEFIAALEAKKLKKLAAHKAAVAQRQKQREALNLTPEQKVEKARVKYRDYYTRNASKVRAAKVAAKHASPEKQALYRNKRWELASKQCPIPIDPNSILLLLSEAVSCPYCTNHFNDTTHKRSVDHITPLSRGGLHALSNMQAACRSCNSSKHNRTHEEFVLIMLVSMQAGQRLGGYRPAEGHSP